MNFIIIENIRNHNEWDSIKGLFSGLLKILLLLILIPFFLIGLLISQFKNNDEKREYTNEWIKFYSDEKLSIKRIFIDENELPLNLDYPEVSNDIYLFKIKSEPELPELKDKFFDLQFIKNKNGIFLLSYNTKGEGMSIWFIDKKKPLLKKIMDLESSWWSLREKNGKINIETTLNKKDIKFEIESVGTYET